MPLAPPPKPLTKKQEEAKAKVVKKAEAAEEEAKEKRGLGKQNEANTEAARVKAEHKAENPKQKLVKKPNVDIVVNGKKAHFHFEGGTQTEGTIKARFDRQDEEHLKTDKLSHIDLKYTLQENNPTNTLTVALTGLMHGPGQAELEQDKNEFVTKVKAGLIKDCIVPS